MARGRCSWSRCLGIALASLVLVTSIFLEVRFHIHKQIFVRVISSIVFFRTRSAEAIATYIASYVGACLIGMPSTPFEIASGFNFGLLLGVAVDLAGRLLSAIVSFCIGRLLLRCGAERCVKGSPVLAGVGTAVEEQGLKFLLLFNLAYLPVAVKNYGLGMVPQVSLGKFLAGIMIVEVPVATMWALIGDRAAHNFEENGISFTNITEVRHVLSGGSVGSPVRWCILAAGVVSVLLLLRGIHAQVSSAMKRTGCNTEKGAATAALV